MLPKLSFVLMVFMLVSSVPANGGKLQNTSSNKALHGKAPHSMDQTFNINNWGLEKADRKLLTGMKYKIDALYGKFRKACRDDGWVRHGNSLFLIINIPTLKWSDARRTCQMLGGDLAIIRSAAENNFIFDLVKKQKTFTAWGAWLGYARKADNKIYWIDDTPLARGYTAWGRGEPSSLSEKCGNMFGAESRGGKWNDLSCDLSPAHLKYAPVILCQKKAN